MAPMGCGLQGTRPLLSADNLKDEPGSIRLFIIINMDVSPVHSGSKCSSDFSIERILSDDSKSREASGEVPSWLCCTRYQPPRIPRASNSNTYRARRSGRHARVPFTAAQAAALEAAYARAPYLAPPALRALAAALQLRDDRIKIWFQNRRARARREKCATITPPQAITLPPTTLLQGTVTANTWTSNFSVPIPSNFEAMESPQDLSSSAATVTQSHGWNESIRELFVENRPETPLDIETIEEN